LKQGIENAKTYLASRLVTPYPPGVPVLVPSQIIKLAHIKYLEDLIKRGVDIHGCHDNEIYVIEKQ
jgi:lysine decarboxylase/arginine decarboxylase